MTEIPAVVPTPGAKAADLHHLHMVDLVFAELEGDLHLWHHHVAIGWRTPRELDGHEQVTSGRVLDSIFAEAVEQLHNLGEI